MSYATAQLAGEPLLAIGNDFPQTDLEFAATASSATGPLSKTRDYHHDWGRSGPLCATAAAVGAGLTLACATARWPFVDPPPQ